MVMDENKKIKISTAERQLLALGAAMISFVRDNPHNGEVNRTYEIAEALCSYYTDAFAHIEEDCVIPGK
jgi:hypothetical protein